MVESTPAYSVFSEREQRYETTLGDISVPLDVIASQDDFPLMKEGIVHFLLRRYRSSIETIF